MSAYIDLNPLLRAWFSFCTCILLLASIGALFLNYQFYRRGAWFRQALLSAFCSYLLLQLELSVMHRSLGREEKWIPAMSGLAARIPTWLVLGVFFLLVFFVAGLLAEIVIQSRTDLSLLSVKEGIDALHTGLCCYWEGGLIRLANPKMEELCRQVTGEERLDGEKLWALLSEGKSAGSAEILSGGERPAARFDDGSVYAFSREELQPEENEGDILYALVATDVTEEWNLSAELSKQEEVQRQFNQRLIRLGQTMDETGARGEILSMKIRIHDAMGRALVATRYYLSGSRESGEQISGSELTALWKEALLFRSIANQEEYDDRILEELESAADAIGLKITVDGELPLRNPGAMNMILSAARECLTNASRHADAEQLMIRVRREEGPFLTVEFRNDGRPPEGPVREGGGLSSLRQLVESRMGRMEIQSTPEFALILRIPETDERS